MTNTRRIYLAGMLLIAARCGCAPAPAEPEPKNELPAAPAKATDPVAAAPEPNVPVLEAGAWFNLSNGKKALEAEDLRGKIVFVEFWATW